MVILILYLVALPHITHAHTGDDGWRMPIGRPCSWVVACTVVVVVQVFVCGCACVCLYDSVCVCVYLKCVRATPLNVHARKNHPFYGLARFRPPPPPLVRGVTLPFFIFASSPYYTARPYTYRLHF